MTRTKQGYAGPVATASKQKCFDIISTITSYPTQFWPAHSRARSDEAAELFSRIMGRPKSPRPLEEFCIIDGHTMMLKGIIYLWGSGSKLKMFTATIMGTEDVAKPWVSMNWIPSDPKDVFISFDRGHKNEVRIAREISKS